MNQLLYHFLIVCCLIIVIFANEGRHLEVIVVGAGAAGIAAATKLLENNVTDIKILEADNRIGGRILSVYFGSGYVDLGAEWCQEDDFIYQLARKYDILRLSPYKRQLVRSDVTCVDSGISDKLMNFFSSFRDSNKTKLEERQSFGEVFLKNYTSTILDRENDPQKREIYLDAIPLFENIVDGRQGSSSWHTLASTNDYEHSKAPSFNWNGLGFKTVLDIMMKKYPNHDTRSPIDDKILLNKLVTRVKWENQSKNIKVECADGSRLEAKYVVFTPSLGVLKAKHREIFEPGLPAEKMEAIDAIGFGSLIKVALHFPQKWWTGNFDDTNLMWTREDLKNLVQEFPYGPNEDNESWLSGSYLIMQAENNANVLIVWYSGNFVPDIEKASDDVVLNGTMFIVRKFFGNSYEISQADQMIRSSWLVNPNFLGVYKFETVSSRRLSYNVNDKLAEPLISDVDGTALLFAGEGASKRHYGSVQGALESGHKEAERILKLRTRSR